MCAERKSWNSESQWTSNTRIQYFTQIFKLLCLRGNFNSCSPIFPVTRIRSQILCQRGNYHTPLGLSTQAQKKLFTWYLQICHSYPLDFLSLLLEKWGTGMSSAQETYEGTLYTSQLCKTQMSVNPLDGLKCTFRISPIHPSLSFFFFFAFYPYS